ncbi:MAG: hypothetical protein B6U73_00175 [Desulfurococcales archaeon ex4484_204]|nr:MAG: hypothetical protein B6U73_00175 [Desulfurococcales archaeon ex4484_204]
MAIITLVSHLVAREGYTFIHEGYSERCLNCRFKKVCIDRLKKGHIYRVVKVLGLRNRCPVNGYVVSVVVDEVPIEIALPKKLAVEGMTVRYPEIKCDRSKCQYLKLCKPRLLKEGSRIKVLTVKERIKCPLNQSLVVAKVLLID